MQEYVSALLPGLSLICCVYFLFRTNSSAQYRIVVAILAAMSACQVFAYTIVSKDQEAAVLAAHGFLMLSYYLAAAFVIFTSRLCIGQLPHQILAYMLPGMLTAAHVTGAFVETFTVSRHAIVHIDGEYSYVVDFYHVLCGVICIGLLTGGIVRNASYETFTRSILLIPATLFAVIVLSLFVLLSRTSYAIDASVIMPATTIYFVWALYRIDIAHAGLSMLQRIVTRLPIIVELVRTEPNKLAIKAFSKKLERQMYVEQLARHDYSVRLAAEAMEVHQSTIRDKIREHDITVPDQPLSD